MEDLILINLIENNIKKILFEFSICDEIYNCSIYSILNGGKKIRALYCINIYLLFNKNISDEIIEFASLIEIIHSTSLMLDDLPCMDNAHLRRNKNTSHIEFGEDITILTCILLINKVTKKINEIEDKSLYEEFFNSIGLEGLIGGQYEDLHKINNTTKIDELEKNYYKKTIKLFELACICAISLSNNVDKEIKKKLLDLTYNLGLVFQIKDDILDITSSEKEIGKNINKDILNNKPNYVTIMGLDESKKKINEKIKEIELILTELPLNNTINLKRIISKLNL